MRSPGPIETRFLCAPHHCPNLHRPNHTDLNGSPALVLAEVPLPSGRGSAASLRLPFLPRGGPLRQQPIVAARRHGRVPQRCVHHERMPCVHHGRVPCTASATSTCPTPRSLGTRARPQLCVSSTTPTKGVCPADCVPRTTSAAEGRVHPRLTVNWGVRPAPPHARVPGCAVSVTSTRPALLH